MSIHATCPNCKTQFKVSQKKTPPGPEVKRDEKTGRYVSLRPTK